MWLAHALTLSRIPIAFGLWFTYGDPASSVVLVLLAAATDTADGNVARWMQRRGHTAPAIGSWLDPLVDKLFVTIVLVVIWAHSRDLLVVVLVGLRELLLVPLLAMYLAKHQRVARLRPDRLGKAATVAQFLALAVIIGAPRWALPAAALTAALGVIALVHYIVREVRVWRLAAARAAAGGAP